MYPDFRPVDKARQCLQFKDCHMCMKQFPSLIKSHFYNHITVKYRFTQIMINTDLVAKRACVVCSETLPLADKQSASDHDL